MKEKKILDIRLFEEIEGSKSLPHYAGKSYQIEKEVHSIGTRFARKLREQGFITGEFDHVYIVLTPLLEEQVIMESERRPEKWMRYFYVGVSVDSFNCKTSLEKEEYILQLISTVLKKISINEAQMRLVSDVQHLLHTSGSEIEITHLSKGTSKYKVTITYQIRPLHKQSTAIIEYHDLMNNVRRKSVFLELNMYEDIYFLASSITLKDGIVCIKPRTSQTANYHIKSYETPIFIPINEIPIIGPSFQLLQQS